MLSCVSHNVVVIFIYMCVRAELLADLSADTFRRKFTCIKLLRMYVRRSSGVLA